MRKIISLNGKWQYGECVLSGEDKAKVASWQEVTVPHVWNLENASQMAPRMYQCVLPKLSIDTKQSVYLEFGAVGGVCRVWLNDTFIGEHRGGYSRFRFAITEALLSEENTLSVLADNTRYPDLIPLGGDFNNYGGIYRDVKLIVTESSHFDLLYYGTVGLTVEAEASGKLKLSSRITNSAENLEVEYLIAQDSDSDKVVANKRVSTTDSETEIIIENPILWDGLSKPAMYRCTARLFRKTECIDEVSLQFGFRSISMTPEQGLMFNEKPVLICGVAKHQDFEGAGSATTVQQLDTDMALIREIGANSVRLSHYQHPDYFYDLCDREGLLVWAEIPMLEMPDGNDAVMENAKQQLTELILQCAHHPSIYCWGIQNEIAIFGESLEMYKKTAELNALAKSLDPTRLTASANLYVVNNRSQLNYITDFVGYNVYFGWYYDEMEGYDTFFDNFHTDNPQIPLGLSEYGVDSSVTLHSDAPKRKDYSEEFQALFHEIVYPKVRERKWLWGSYVWNMFDFGSAIREEGGTKGKNCKGLVTFDRKIKKDAFYYYKAWWSSEPFVYLGSRRFVNRHTEKITVTIYSNQPTVELYVNDQFYGAVSSDKVFRFSDVPLQAGKNFLRVQAGKCTDECTFNRVENPDPSYVFVDPNPEINVKNWFTLETSEEDLFPKDRFSIMDTMGDLMASPEAWKILEKAVPRITGHPRATSMPGMTLFRIINRTSGAYEEAFIKELNRKLNTVKK